jgi:hypothetical protein
MSTGLNTHRPVFRIAEACSLKALDLRALPLTDLADKLKELLQGIRKGRTWFQHFRANLSGTVEVIEPIGF